MGEAQRPEEGRSVETRSHAEGGLGVGLGAGRLEDPCRVGVPAGGTEEQAQLAPLSIRTAGEEQR